MNDKLIYLGVAAAIAGPILTLLGVVQFFRWLFGRWR